MHMFDSVCTNVVRSLTK